jgi:hypothetical protein
MRSAVMMCAAFVLAVASLAAAAPAAPFKNPRRPTGVFLAIRVASRSENQSSTIHA